jgi:hypothetical protein
MADTGSPWNLPYPLPTDLVRDGADAIKDLAEAAATGLDAAGGLVAVKHALFTGTQTNSTAAGANFAVTNLSITHTMASASNKLIISAYIGAAAIDTARGAVGIAVADGATLIGIGDVTGARTSLAAGGQVSVNGTGDTITVAMPSITFVYAPGDVSAHTYTVRAFNVTTSTHTVYINRAQSDTNDAFRPRSSSALVVQEVKV